MNIIEYSFWMPEARFTNPKIGTIHSTDYAKQTCRRIYIYGRNSNNLQNDYLVLFTDCKINRTVLVSFRQIEQMS